MLIYSDIFLCNRYTHWYYALITRAIARHRKKTKTGPYYENHHIVPKALGGTYDKANMVLLTPKEHFIAHRLLTRMTSGIARSKMLRALGAVASMKQEHYSSVQFAIAREAAAQAQRERFTPEYRAELSAKLKGRKKPPRSPEHSAAISRALSGSKRGSPSAETRASISIALRKRQPSEEERQKLSKKMSETMRGRTPHNKGKKVSESDRRRMREGWAKRRSLLAEQEPSHSVLL